MTRNNARRFTSAPSISDVRELSCDIKESTGSRPAGTAARPALDQGLPVKLRSSQPPSGRLSFSSVRRFIGLAMPMKRPLPLGIILRIP